MIPDYPMIRYQYLSSCELLWKTAKQKGSQNSELKTVSKFDIDRAIYKIEQLYTIQRSCNRNNLTEMKFIINKNGWHSSCFIITYGDGHNMTYERPLDWNRFSLSNFQFVLTIQCYFLNFSVIPSVLILVFHFHLLQFSVFSYWFRFNAMLGFGLATAIIIYSYLYSQYNRCTYLRVYMSICILYVLFCVSVGVC